MSDPSGVPEAADRLKSWRKWRNRIYKAYAAGVAISLTGAFAESFRNLVTYFQNAGYQGIYAIIAPTMVDIFTIGGETLVLIATIEGWERKYKIAGWVATFVGLAVSVAGNAGKDGWTVPGPHHTRLFISWGQIGTFSIPPLAMAGLLALALMIVKRALKGDGDDVVSGVSDVPQDALVALTLWPDHARAGTLPPVREITRRLNCGQPRAGRIRAYLTDLHEAFVAAEDSAGEDETVTR